MNFELVPIDSLVPHPENRRRGDIPKIAESIRSHGFQGAVLCQLSSRRIIAGEHRWRAAQSEGMTEIPVLWTDVDDDTALRLMLADNAASDAATYDEAGLADLLERVRVSDRGLVGTGWDDTSTRELLTRVRALDRRLLTEDDEAVAPPTEPVTKPGDLWTLGQHRLLCGDATSAADHERVLGGATADLVLTDPPYGVGLDYGPETEDTAESVRAMVAKFMPLVLTHRAVLLTPGHRCLFDYPRPQWVLAWVHSAGNGRGPWGFTTYNPIMAYGPDPYIARGLGSRPDSLVLAADRQGEEGHPVIKPLPVWEWLMERGSVDPGEVVFDPFCGSGTTIIAAERLSRVARGIEISPAYCDVAVARWERLTGQVAERVT